MQRKNIKLDPAGQFALASRNAIHRGLAKVHGNGFALCFIAEYADAIQRAISKRLCERTKAVVFIAAQLPGQGDCDPQDGA